MYLCPVFRKYMNMKKILTLAAAILCAMLFTTCDKIESPFYEIVNVEDVTVDFPELDPNQVYRKILFEEFTGHRCTNCPDGHKKLEEIQERYGDTLIAVGIHFGSLAKPVGSTYSYDFRTESGNIIGESYAIDAIPAAIVNRNDKEGGWQRAQWMNVVSSIDRSSVPAALQLVNEYNGTDSTLKANVKMTMLTNYDRPIRLVIYLVEDGIVKPQKDGDQDILDYVHNHVLRATLTDPFGYYMNDASDVWLKGDEGTFAATIDFSGKDWNMNNCYVVAFLLDNISHDVLQVEKLDAISR